MVSGTKTFGMHDQVCCETFYVGRSANRVSLPAEEPEYRGDVPIAQTLPEGSQQYMNVFKTAVLYHPENPVANLNAACIALMQGDVVSAEKYLLRAPDSKEKHWQRVLPIC